MGHAPLFDDVAPDHADCLRDESRCAGCADSISFPKTEEEVRTHLAAAMELGRSVTVQGARTGITGGAVPNGGHILNLSRMKQIVGLRQEPGSGHFILTAQPGVLLSELRASVSAREFDARPWSEASRAVLDRLRSAGPQFFPPDPTETSASIGGMVSCNASGACTFRYGPTRRYVERLRCVLADGSALDVSRGATPCRARSLDLATASGRVIRTPLPSYRMPRVKSAAGYFVDDPMDPIDLFIGSEGTLCVVSEVDLRIIPLPSAIWGITAFLPAPESALEFVARLKSAEHPAAAIEFFDGRALDLLRRQKSTNPAFASIPDLPRRWNTAVYAEYHGEDAYVEEAAAEMSDLMVKSGGDGDATWVASDAHELLRLKQFRHAVPESVNLLIDERRRTEPTLTKLGTDLAVPDGHLADVMAMYQEGLSRVGLEFVIFGHIGNNHVHVNILPRNLAEYDHGKALYLEWARRVVAMGGTVSAEHGIGKLKAALLREMYGEEGIRQMRAVKTAFDPGWVLNPGNLFDRG